MANEPERPIERLLRAAAKKRRDEAGAPLELHPATRRLLQGEVARKHTGAEREGRSFFQGLRQLWPQLAWGAAIFAVLVVTARVLLTGWPLLPGTDKDKPGDLLAKNQALPHAMPAKTPPPPLPAAEEAAPAPPAAAVKAKPATVAFAETAQPSPAIPARRALAPPAGVQPQALPKDSLAAQTSVEMREKLALAASPSPANRNKTTEAGIVATSETPVPAPAAVANGAFDQPARSFGQAASLASTPAAPASPPPVATPPAVASVVVVDESKKLGFDRASQPGFAYKSLPAVASANAPGPSAAPTDGLLIAAAGDRKEAQSLRAIQRFAQVAPSPKTKASLADKATPARPVLASFQIEQAGRELRIVDGDGSVYSGYLQIADAVRRRRSVKAEAPAATRAPQALGGVLEKSAAAGPDSDQAAAQTYFFRVTGTNRSLQKKVVFTGNLTAATNWAWFQQTTNYLTPESGLAGFQGEATQPRLLPLLHSRISGKLVIGSGKAVEINALPTSP